MNKEILSKFDDVTVARSYMVTFGLIIVLMAGFIGISVNEIGWHLMLISLGLLAGLYFMGIGFFSSSEKALDWADGCSKHEISIIIMIIAFPICYIWVMINRLLGRK